jgi:peptidoglycan/LPS O-acetylase OafA/YrhL
MNTAFDQRANNFDFLRMVLAVLVIFSHSYSLGTGDELREPFSLLTHGQTTGGSIAVDAFFIISGFLIAGSFERSKTLFSYFKKRIFRIYPAFIVLSIVCAVLVVPLSGGAFVRKTVFGDVLDVAMQTIRLKELPYVHAFVANPFPGDINGSIWTIFYEFLCYIGLAVLGFWGILRAGKALFSILAVSVILSVVLTAEPWLFKYLQASLPTKLLGTLLFPRFTAVFMAGVCFYRIRHHVPLRNSWIACAILLLGIATWTAPLWALLFPIAGAYLIFAVAFHPSIPFHGFGRFGDFSYGTYLYAFPIQQLIMLWFGRPVSPFLLFALATPATLLMAVASWYGIERWFLRRDHGTKKSPGQSLPTAEAVHQ